MLYITSALTTTCCSSFKGILNVKTAPSGSTCSSTPTDAWVGNPLALAGFSSGGWRYVAPIEGMAAYVKSQDLWACFRAGAWELGLLRGSSVVIGDQQVVGGRAAAIPSATGGTVVDTEARAAIDLVLGALRQHGLIES